MVSKSMIAAAAAALAGHGLAQSSCVSGNQVHVILARGTTEPQNDGMTLENNIINSIKLRLPGSDDEGVVYPASFDLPSSPNAGVAAAFSQVTSYANRCPNSKIVLMGYSQGAQVIGDMIAGGGTTTPNGSKTNAVAPLDASVMSHVISVILFGDPNRIGGKSYDKLTCQPSATNPRTGAVAQKFNSYSALIQDYCDASDPVCCSTGNNILAHLGYFNSDNGKAVADFVAAKAGAPASSSPFGFHFSA